MTVKLTSDAAGLIRAIQIMEAMTNIWEKNSQLRRRPKRPVNPGSGILSTIGAQINLNEYPRAAQLKKVTADLLTPASRSHMESVEKIRRIGTPAENPRKSMVKTLGCVQA